VVEARREVCEELQKEPQRSKVCFDSRRTRRPHHPGTSWHQQPRDASLYSGEPVPAVLPWSAGIPVPPPVSSFAHDTLSQATGRRDP